MAGTKKEDIPIEMMRSIYAVVSDRENYPLLIHCNHGRHRTGCVVGVLRKSSQWNMKRISKLSLESFSSCNSCLRGQSFSVGAASVLFT